MFDVAGARSAGYSDDEIVQHLARSGRAGFDFAGAAKAGYSNSQILDAIAQRSQGGVDTGTRTADGRGIIGVGPLEEARSEGQEGPKTAPADTDIMSAPAAGAGHFVSGIGKTIKHYTPFTRAGERLEGTGDSITPKNYQSARIVNDDYSVNLSEAPRAVAEAAPGMAAGIVAARALSRLPKVGPVIGALAGAGGMAALSGLGQRAEDRATASGEDPQNPSTATKLAVLPSMAVEAGLEGVGAHRFLPGVGKATSVGSRGVAEAGGRLARTAATEGATEGAQNVVEQTGRTLGAEGGLRIDPAEALNAGATGVAAGGTFGATRAAREAGQARRYKDIDTAVAPEVADDISRTANGNLNTRGGFDAVRRVEQNYKADIAAAVSDFRKETGATVDGVLTRARRGEANDADIADLTQRAQGTQSGPAVVQLAKKLTTLQRLKETGSFKNGKFKGGLGASMENALWFLSNPQKAGLVTLPGMVGLGAMNPGAIIHAPASIAGLTGLYGAARILDRSMGTRSPAKAFVERFGGQAATPGPSVGSSQQPPPAGPQPQPTPTPPPGAGAQQGPWGPIPVTPTPNPTGPKVRLPNTLPAVVPQPQPQTAYAGNPDVMYSGAAPADLQLPSPRAANAPDAPMQGPPRRPLSLPRPSSIKQPAPDEILALPAPERAQLPAVRRPDPLMPDGVERAVINTMDAAADAVRERRQNSVTPEMRALAKRLAGRHNADVRAERDRKPIVNDGEPAPLPKPSMVEEMNEQGVLEALRAGKSTFGEIRAHTEIDAQDLKATLNRMKVEGKVNLDGAGVTEVGTEKPKPTKARTMARAAVKAKPKKAEPESGRLNYSSAGAVRQRAEPTVDLDTAFSVAKGQNSGLSTVPISSLAAATKMPLGQLHDLLKREALNGNVSLHFGSHALSNIPDAVRKAGITYDDGEQFFYATPLAEKPRAPSRDQADDIPAFLRRRPGNTLPGIAPKAADKPKRYEHVAMRRTDHPVSDVEETIKAATDSWLKSIEGNPYVKDAQKGKDNIERITRTKFEMADAIDKEVHDFDKKDFLAMLYDTRSLSAGQQLRNTMKLEHPKSADVFDRVLSDTAFKTIYKHKASRKDGTRK